jgi:HK97 family phage prohead protease
MSTTATTRYAFQLDGKALTATPLADGDLLLEGWAARWEEDREQEAFDPAAFDHGIKAFVDGTAALCFQHRGTDVLGRVLSLERRPDGIWMRARVDGAIRHDPRLRTIYEQVKKGTIRGASVGGFFRRAQRAGRQLIDRVDLTEISLTAVPVGGHRTTLAVVAGKALAEPAMSAHDVDRRMAVVELRAAQRQLGELRSDVLRLRTDAVLNL